jgi:DNA-binding transcriptional LysR family regulator
VIRGEIIAKIFLLKIGLIPSKDALCAFIGREDMLDLMRLMIFIHSAESKNFSQAAKELHITQPTVSHHIKALENDVGKRLFERGGGRLQLTEAGRLLLPWARKLVRESIELQEMMASIEENVVGQLYIACSTTTGKYILPQFAARFHARHPAVRVTIMSCTSEDVVPNLLEEEANIGVVSYDPCGGKLECQEFFLDRIVLIAPPDHPWASLKSIEPSALVNESFILREPSSGTRKVMLAELGKQDISIDEMNVSLEVGNAEAIVKSVEAGFGVSFVSRLSAAWALELGNVVEIPVEGFDLRRLIYMIRKQIQEPNRAAEAFWGFVHDPENKDLLRLAEK